ncbi:MAG: sulfurtransferase [Planctomycetes bacterium]|nr:sulfurtransferase [Planctomycetota bacterium]
MPTITNIAAYKFAPLQDLKPLRERLIQQCKAWGLRGTILLSPEGINLFVAGLRAPIDRLLGELRAVPGLAGLEVKVSDSDHQPFHRMLVKIKKEIIAFGVEGIDPAHQPAPRVSARELKQWLDEGRPVTLLDTRNDYEVKLGTFHNAVPIGVQHFRNFPDAVRKLPAELKRQPIVTFCTGGIRCEKAAPFMLREGFEKIFQLDGGILKYFEECGSAHYDGECFVFDQRVGVDPSLHETDSTQCHACQTPLSVDDQQDPRYVAGKSCPYCHRSTELQRAEEIQRRQEAIRRVTTPLPGSQPYDNFRPVKVPASFDGRTLLECLSGLFGHVPIEDWRRHCEAGRMLSPTGEPVGADHVVQVGERYLQRKPETVEPDVNVNIQILHEDEAILVLNKPAPLPMHPCGRFNRNTLQYILGEVYKPQSPRPAHRLDANTSGVVVLSRTRHVASLLQPQFERGEVEKMYLARVQGHPPDDQFECRAAISDCSGDLGSRETVTEGGLPAVTLFRVLERFPDQTALLEVIPRTGRTNQIRVHLWHLGWPICGDQAYLPGRTLGETQTHPVNAPPLCLFAHRITITHPLSRQRLTFEGNRPAWAMD